MADLLAAGIAAHRQGQLQQAERAYRTLLAQQPYHPDATHLLGVIALQCKQLPAALELLRKAVALGPREHAFHANLAEACRAAGIQDEAIKHCHIALRLKPVFAEALNCLGLIFLNQKLFAEAAEQFHAALAAQPQLHNARLNLGNALREQNDWAGAKECYEAVVAANPNSAEGYANLGQLLLDLEEVAAALPLLERAVQLRPDLAEGQNNLGNALRELSKFDAAEQAYQAALQLNPNLALTHANLGQLAQQRGQFERAIAEYERSLEIAPQSARTLCHYASLKVEQENLADAHALYRRAVAAEPKSAEPYLGLAQMALETGAWDDANRLLQTVLQLDPENTAAFQAQAELATIHGDQATAVARLQQVLELEPRSVGAYHSLVNHLGKGLPEDAFKQMSLLVHDPDLKPRQRMLLSYAMGKSCDHRGQYSQAVRHWATANQLCLADWKRRGLNYDAARHTAHVDQLMDVLDADFFARTDGWGYAGQGPIFVLGFPRSGTTLTEQILAGHPAIHAAGELSLVRQLFQQIPELVGRPTDGSCGPLDCLSDLAPVHVQQLAQIHLARLRELSPKLPHVVDKLPDNYLNLGFIALLFPNARVVHVRRDLRDVALSCWMTHFKSIRWSCDPHALGGRIVDYQRVMAHWNRVLPLSIYEVQYEDLVADFETQAQHLVEWLGLDWDPRCLAFHEQERPIRTASTTQVRQPLYNRAAGRWQKYERDLAGWLKLVFAE